MLNLQPSFKLAKSFLDFILTRFHANDKQKHAKPNKDAKTTQNIFSKSYPFKVPARIQPQNVKNNGAWCENMKPVILPRQTIMVAEAMNDALNSSLPMISVKRPLEEFMTTTQK